MKCNNYPNIFPKLLGWHFYCCLDIQFLLVALQPRELTLRTVADSGSSSSSRLVPRILVLTREKTSKSQASAALFPKYSSLCPPHSTELSPSVVSACEHAACAVLFPQFWLVILLPCNCKLLCSYFDIAKDKNNPFLD